MAQALGAQEFIPEATPKAPAGPIATVHGIVRNGASGEPLPRALVRIDGDATSGTLTDSSGRFELPSVPVGPQEFQVIKPGFLDQAAAGAENSSENVQEFAHNVIVTAEMPDVVFTMAPVNSIRGQVQLSTGDPAQGIGVTLLKRIVQDGRIVWQAAANAKTNSEGIYHFGGLADGVFALYTEPAMDSDPATNVVEAGNGSNVTRSGYASQFYPESRDLAGAAKIRLAGGDLAQANFSLTLEPFQSVTATVVMPGSRQYSDVSGERSGASFSAVVMDAQGHQLLYSAQYDPATRTIQTFLPDGTYSLLVTGITQTGLTFSGSRRIQMNSPPMTGQVDFAVAGRAVSKLRIPLSPTHSSLLQVTVNRSGSQQPQGGDGAVYVMLSQTGGWIADGVINQYAQGAVSTPLETTYMPPGPYWAHTSIAQKNLCETSFTAGGASLAREPLVLGISGSTAPLSLALRDDCASLTLSLPASMDTLVAGVEPYYTIYVVPDFDSTDDVVPQTLRASTGGRITLTGLTPGSYHVYTFDRPEVLEYRNPAALAALPNPGQAVTLSPGAKSEFVVEGPER